MKTINNMSVAELEQESYRLTEQRQQLRAEALAVQAALSKRVEEQRISQLLGRDVQIIEAVGIEGKEALGIPSGD